MATEERRARYWARSFAGWHEFAAVQPNRAHYALAEMQRMGWADSIITQNVDRLHHKAGSRDIIELHGTTHRQVCIQKLKPLHSSCLRLLAIEPPCTMVLISTGLVVLPAFPFCVLESLVAAFAKRLCSHACLRMTPLTLTPFLTVKWYTNVPAARACLYDCNVHWQTASAAMLLAAFSIR